MPFFDRNQLRQRVLRSLFLFITCLFISLFALAQVNLRYRSLSGYALSSEAPVNKSKPTLFVFEQAETFGQVFKAAVTGKRADRTDFDREMVVGVAVPPSGKPPKLSISKVFVQDSTLTVRYVRMNDTTAVDKAPVQPATSLPAPQSTLLIAIPKQTVLKTKLVENGKVVQTILKHRSE